MIGVLHKRKVVLEDKQQRKNRLVTEKYILDQERASIVRSRETLRMEWERLEADRPLLPPQHHERVGQDLLALSRELDERKEAFLRRYKSYRQEKPIWWEEKVVQKNMRSIDHCPSPSPLSSYPSFLRSHGVCEREGGFFIC